MKRKNDDHTQRRVKTRTMEEDPSIPIKPVVRPDFHFPFKTNTLEDLLNIAWNYKGDSFDWMMLWLLIPALTELNGVVGMTELKKGVIDFVLYHIQGFNSGISLHTIVSGPPGCGKTEVAKIIAKIYKGLGFLKTDTVLIVEREGCLGFSAEKNIKEYLEKAKGGVLFIDETDVPSKDTDRFGTVIAALNQHLPENSLDLVCMISGNEDELEKYMFSVGLGVKSRFPWHFPIQTYSVSEMLALLKTKVKKEGWILDGGAITEEFFVRGASAFPASGRDIANLFLMCKIAHCSRVFGTLLKKKLLVKADIQAGFEKYKSMKKRDQKATLSYFG